MKEKHELWNQKTCVPDGALPVCSLVSRPVQPLPAHMEMGRCHGPWGCKDKGCGGLGEVVNAKAGLLGPCSLSL